MHHKIQLRILLIFLTILSSSCTKDPEESTYDINGNQIKTIRIGNQVWMTENLRVTSYRNGKKITNAQLSYDSITSSDYGRLYDYTSISDTSNICPVGWHIPSDSEWVVLANYLGGENIAGDKLKEGGTKHWAYPNQGAKNTSGFKALPSGFAYLGLNSFDDIGNKAIYWTSTTIYSPFGNGRQYIRKLNFLNSDLAKDSIDLQPSYYYAIRCIKD